MSSYQFEFEIESELLMSATYHKKDGAVSIDEVFLKVGHVAYDITKGIPEVLMQRLQEEAFNRRDDE
jgi:hypothetical protein